MRVIGNEEELGMRKDAVTVHTTGWNKEREDEDKLK